MRLRSTRHENTNVYVQVFQAKPFATQAGYPSVTVVLLTAAVCVLLFSSLDSLRAAAAGPAHPAQPLPLAVAAAHPPAGSARPPGRAAESEAQAAAWQQQAAFCDGLASLDFSL